MKATRPQPDPEEELQENCNIPDWLLWLIICVFGFGWIVAGAFCFWLMRTVPSLGDL